MSLLTAAPELLDIMRRIVRVAKMNRYRDSAQLSLGATPLIEEAEAAIRKAERISTKEAPDATPL